MNTLKAMMDRGVFPTTFHNYSPWGSPAGRPEAVRDWVDLGITIGRSPGYLPERDKKKDMLAMLDACAEAGIMLFVNDARCSVSAMTNANCDEDAYRRGFEASLKDFGDHPANFGYDVADEPAHDAITRTYRTYAIQREMAPHLTPFMSTAGYTPEGAGWMGLRSYQRYIDELVETGDPLLLFQGSYYMLHESDDAIEKHFLTHKMFTDAMVRHRLPVWITLCCTGHYTLRCPDQEDIAWQIGISTALGHKGLAWFNVYTHRTEENYRWAPINEFGERTHTFEYLSYELRKLQKTHGPKLLELDFQKAYHIGNERLGGYPNTIDSELVKAVDARTMEFPLMISEFKDAQGRDYVALLANTKTGYGQCVITWHGKPTVYKVGWEGQEKEYRVYFDDKWPENPTKQTGPWMGPGQVVLYRVESDAPERL